MFRLKRLIHLVLVLGLTGLVLLGRAAADNSKPLTLATTTSTRDSGLLEVLVPPFEKRTGIKVKVIAVGTGQAIELGKRGDADLLMVHAPALEKEFVKQGFGTKRYPLMYNDFVMVGASSDPAQIRGERSASQAFRKIAAAQALFVSRGDNSGTHVKELTIWKKAQLKPQGAWYLEAGSGMAATLRMASEKQAYTLTDRGTYLSQRKHLELDILCQGDPLLFNPYSVIPVNPRKFPDANYEGAYRFIAYLLAPGTQETIANYGKQKFGQPLFYLYQK